MAEPAEEHGFDASMDDPLNASPPVSMEDHTASASAPADGDVPTHDANSPVEASMSEPSTANGTSDGSAVIHSSAAVPQEPTEEDKYWKNVQENVLDFSSWTYLIQLIERQQGDIEKIRKAYDGFLGHFPLCYVYWKKYADHENNRGNFERSLEVYERGVHGIPHSVDLWTYYCTYVSEKSEDLDLIRNLWERGAHTVGSDFSAHAFWDKYIEFETSQGSFPRVTAIYHRLLHTPLDQLTQYFERFKAHMTTRPLSELLSAGEVAELEQEKASHEAKYKELVAKKEDGEAVDPTEMALAGVKTGDEVEIDFRARVMASREETYKKTLEEVTKRRTYEFGVNKRPYFHVKPLDDVMLSNWRKYLDLEEKESTGTIPARVIKLYERCLVAACYYSEFWLRYTRWLETHRTVDEARAVFVRATTIFLTRRPDVHLEYALFEESQGNAAKARQVYENLGTILPGHVESTLRFASFERRQGNTEAACAIYDTSLSIASVDAKSGPFLSMHYARFLDKVVGSPARAREVYDKALQKFPEHKGLWMSYIQFEIGVQGEGMESRVLGLYARAVAEDSKLTSDEKFDLWQSYVEFASDWSNNVGTLRKLQDSFRALYPASSYRAETSRKRPLDAANAHDVAGSGPALAHAQPNKVARTAPAVAAVPATTVPAAAALAANYAAAAQQYTYPYAAQYNYAAYNPAATAAATAATYTYPYTAAATAANPAAAAAAAAAAAQYAGYAYPYAAAGYTQPSS